MKQLKKMIEHPPVPSIIKYLNNISVGTILLSAGLVGGCNYYKVNTPEPLNNSTIAAQVENRTKYIVLHQGGKVWHLKEIVVDESREKLTGIIEILSPNHLYYQHTKRRAPNIYKSNKYKTDLPIHEIHLYTSQDSIGAPGSLVNIPFTDITKFEVYDPDVGATVFSVFGATMAIVGVVAIVVALTKSSCPFVYTNNGTEYIFAGEMFGGAIYPTLERDDYMPLPGFRPIDSTYQLRIANQLLEKQYTNLANLVVVEHPDNTSILLDKTGRVQAITDPKIPFIAKSGTGVDYLEKVSLKDGIPYLFDEETPGRNDISNLIVQFKRPTNALSGKLLINAKNSFWLDYAYGKFNELFGTYYNTFAEKQKKVSAQDHNQWSLDQNIPLSVYVETRNGWALVDYVNTPGPLASRDLVIPIGLSDVEGEEVRIKLECGFMFWELDYVALDFSENIPVKITEIIPSSAVDEKGKNVSGLIAATDSRYLIQPAIGNVATVQYPAITPADGNSQTVFLHSRGYYEYIREYKNWPDVRKLLSFKQKGSFTKFSKEQYTEFIQNDELLAAALSQRNEN
jgi:hypothetical protein